MNFIFEISGFTLPLWLVLLVTTIMSFLIVCISIPIIVKVSRLKKIFDIPNERTSHNTITPILGGLSIFAGFTLSVVLFTLQEDATHIKYIIGSIIVLFFTGLKDDILIIDPKKKLLGQVVAALIIVVLGNIRITSFHFVFGINEISYLPSILFSLFIFLTLINGFNLIDGVDGLASAVGILTSLAVGIWFIFTGHYSYAVLCFSLIGTLIAYSIFNVFGKTNKIFMGDTGSMIIGFIIAVLIVKFLEFEAKAPEKFRFFSAPALAIAILIIPLFDTLRVIIIRLMNGKSPFEADKNHIHHNLVNLGFSHVKTTLMIVSVNLLFILFALIFQKLGDIPLVLLMMFSALVLSLIPTFLLKNRDKNLSNY